MKKNCNEKQTKEKKYSKQFIEETLKEIESTELMKRFARYF